MSLEKILIGTLSGLAAGLAIGYLTAPDKGSETRRKISGSAEELKNRIKRFRHNGAAELEELNACNLQVVGQGATSLLCQIRTCNQTHYTPTVRWQTPIHDDTGRPQRTWRVYTSSRTAP